MTVQQRSPRSRRWAAGLAAVLASKGLASPPRGPVRALTVSILRIGLATVLAETHHPPAARGQAPYLYVAPLEPLVLRLSSPLPPRARLYPLVRREGESHWVVQPGAVGPGGRNVAGEWTAEARFGEPSEVGEPFELLVVAAAEPLPPLSLPDRLRVASTLAESAVIHVERRRERPSVGISAVDGVRVYGEGELRVHDRSKVEVVAHDLPAEAQAGLAIHPLDTEERWVMPELTGEGAEEITATFGAGRQIDEAWRYTLSAFVAWKVDLPPLGQRLSARDWERYQRRFLAQSRLVRAARWESALRITAIGNLAVQAGRILRTGPQEDVRGDADRPLAVGERIWLVCLPAEGEPWVAGWTSRLHPSGRWIVNTAALWQEGKPARFDLVAVLSADDAARVQPGAFQEWAHGEERPHHSVRLEIPLSRPGKAGAPRPRQP